jgi:high-affinity iron transporter
MGALFGVLLVMVASQADGGTTADPEAARKLLFMVQYVAGDYSGAVDGAGVVTNADEYAEAVQTMKEANALYARLKPNGPQGAALSSLAALVDTKAAPPKVETSGRALVDALTRELNITPAPSRIPDLDTGARLYAVACVKCHGAEGKGDGPAAAGLKPPPAPLQDPAWADSRAPFHIFNTLTLGIAGTGMASFAAVYDEDNRWALAFYVLTLRRPAQPPKAHPALNVVTLASQSNQQLVAKLVADKVAPDAAAALNLVDAARRVAPEALSPAVALSRVADAAKKAAELSNKEQRAAAQDLVASAYFESMEPVEPELRRGWPDEVTRLEGAITNLRKAISDGLPVDALANDVAMQADVLRGRVGGVGPAKAAKAPPWGLLGGGLAVALLVIAGLFVLGRRSAA